MFAQNPRNCSVPTPDQASRSSTLDYKAMGEGLPAVSDLVPCNKNAERGLYAGTRIVIQLVIMNHMRCSECLEIKFKDMIRPFMFLVRGKKKSNDYSIHIPLGGGNLNTILTGDNSALVFPFSYNSIWRAMCRAGMSVAVTSRVKNIVTHRARYELSDKLEELNARASITPLLRHKSKNSKTYYSGVMGA